MRKIKNESKTRRNLNSKIQTLNYASSSKFQDKNSEFQYGITLIALVVTIVVLLILAGITINLILGQNSIFESSNRAKTETIHAKVYEALNLMSQDYYIESTVGNSSYSTLLEYLASKGIIDENNVINTEALFGKKESLGNGTKETGDVYVIEKEENLAKVATTKNIKVATTSSNNSIKYKVVYYEEANASSKNLGYLTESTSKGTGTIEKVEPKNIDDWIYYEEDGVITITGYKGRDTEVVVPNYIGGVPVKRVLGNNGRYGASATYVGILWDSSLCPQTHNGTGPGLQNETITHVTISDGIEELGERLFSDSVALVSVIIPKSVMKIGSCCFANCDNTNLIVYCEIESKPDTWNNWWDLSYNGYRAPRTIIWDYKNQNN